MHANLLKAGTVDSTTLLLSGTPVNPGGGLLTAGPRPGGGGSPARVFFKGNVLLNPKTKTYYNIGERITAMLK